MSPEIGTFAIILALCFSLLQALVPLNALRKKQASSFLTLSSITAIGQFLFLSFAMLCLIYCFLNNDMSVVFVREHSHPLLPLIYRIGASWGGHEGSLLLWCLVLSGWTLLFILFHAYRGRNIWHNPKSIPHGVIAVLGFISAGFILFLLITSNPFQRDFPTTLINGEDLTPILQDPGLIFHPPMLYCGYVGFAVGFAFAITALIEGKFDQNWARACRPWIILPWAFLGCGIVLGSWWAYRELGWGGWWFWDPVENASLLPWLAATALLHSLIVTEKRDVFKGWTLLLLIVSFALSLLGTFLVRSGVLVSVHAFASDPTRGIFLLSYLTVLIGGAFFLYGLRIRLFYKSPSFHLFSRETLLLMNSVIMICAVVTIIIGTLYPIILEALNIEKISVGEPYFNAVFVPIILPALLLMAIAPHFQWQQQSWQLLWKKIRWDLITSLILSFLLPYFFGFHFHWLATLGIFFSLWIVFGTGSYALRLWQQHRKFDLRHSAMLVAHLGIAILALGITLNKSYSTERQIKMAPGETVSIADYQFYFQNIAETAGTNYKSLTANFAISKNHHPIEMLAAQQRIYLSHDQTLAKPGIAVNPWRDLYLALGAPLTDGAWSIRIYYKPFVRWIWFGGFMLLLGGLLSVSHLLARRTEHEYC